MYGRSGEAVEVDGAADFEASAAAAADELELMEAAKRRDGEAGEKGCATWRGW